MEKSPYYNYEFRIVISEKESKEYLALIVEVDHETCDIIKDSSNRERVISSLRRLIRENVGVNAEIELMSPNSLERAMHKAKRIIDEGQFCRIKKNQGWEH